MFWFIVIAFIAIIVIGVAVSLSNQKARGETISATKSYLEQEGFSISKQVTDTENNYSLLVDDTNQQWAIIAARNGTHTIYHYSDLIEYEILEDGNSVVKGRVGSVIVGGLLFGGLGALAGGARSKKVKNTCKSMVVCIVVNNLEMPQINIPLISTETKTGSLIHNLATTKAKEIASVLAIIKSKAEQEKDIEANNMPEMTKQFNISDEIEKLHSLKEKGILTEEEFNVKKKQLLGL